MKEIALSQGKIALLDDDDYEKLKDLSWNYNKGYAAHCFRSGGKSRIIYMHRIVSQAKPGEEIHHLNGNSLDNQKSNLAAITHAGHARIHGTLEKFNAACKGKTSRFRGVSWDSRSKRWRVQLHVRDKKYQLSVGYFKDELEAARAYNDAALKYQDGILILNDV